MTPGAVMAQVMVDELVRGGVRDAVLSPGSRSAPMAIALAARPELRLHVRIDERSAGFLALGLSRRSGLGVPVLCSSGTATANLHPAVQEAAASHVGLVVLTADRPPELRGTGVNQTTDQLGLYGSSVRAFVEMGVPENVPGMARYWRSTVARALASAVDGPVHLNVALRTDEPAVQWCEPTDGRPDGAPWSRRSRVVPSGVPLRDAPARGVVLVADGAADPGAALALADALGWPVLSEPTGNARSGPHAISTYAALLDDEEFAEAHHPELVVCVGKPGLSRSVLRWLAGAEKVMVVDPAQDWADPTRTAAEIVPAVPIAERSRASGAWLQSWLAAETLTRSTLDRFLDECRVWTEPRIARDLAAALPDGALLVAGASRPIRDLELAAAAREGVSIIANRGVSGIDGVVSTAVGAALAHQSAGGGPAVALIGDLSMVHDQNGLLIGPDEPRPDLTFVVVDNDGGGIFGTLEHAGEPSFERIFGTPHGTDFAALAAAHRITFADADQPGSLPEVLRTAGLGSPGIGMVRVRTDRSTSARLLADLRAAVVKSLRASR